MTVLQLFEKTDQFFHHHVGWSPRWICGVADLSYSAGEAPCQSRLAKWLYRRLS